MRRAGLGCALLAGAAAVAGAAARWEYAEGGSAVEAALYRAMPMPVNRVLGLRPPREAVPLLGELISRQPGADLYSLRALTEESALDFKGAESDWKKFAETAADRVQAQLALADFYHRRLRPEDEIAALIAAGQAPASASEKLVAPEQQRPYQAFERILTVIRENALPASLSERAYRAWMARYPAEKAVYASFFQFLLEQKSFTAAEKFVAQYRTAFPKDDVFPVKARALLAYRQGSLEQGLAVYDTQFQPLWPPELVQSYFDLLQETHSQPTFLDHARAALERNPDDLGAAARVFYYYQRQGRTDAAQQALAGFRLRREQRGGKWTPQELYTLARLHEGIHAYSEAARYYYALYSSNEQNAQELALGGLTNLLLEAPETSLRLGAGELSMYRDVGTIDPGPGFLNGILSLVLNTTSPAYHYAEEESRAVPYFHRAGAAQLLRLLDERFPNAPRRAPLHARLLQAYAAYGESEAVIRDGQQFLGAFNDSDEREKVALLMADAYARLNREREEYAIYDSVLAELAKKAEGVPLGLAGDRLNAPPQEQAVTEGSDVATEEEEGGEEGAAPRRSTPEASRAFSLAAGPAARTATGMRSPEYSRVLERYLSRLVSNNQAPQALAVLRKEIDRNPNDPGLYERLAQFLGQNRLGAQQEQVYQRAIQQFAEPSWYHKLARFYLREKRNAEYERLTQQVVKIFSGTDLEKYFAEVSSGESYYTRLNEYAHARFPHDLFFVRNLLSAYHMDSPQWEALLRQHWWQAEDLRNRFFEFLSRTGKLDQELATLTQMEANAQRQQWPELASGNPAAARFLAEAGFWRSHFEEAAPVMGALAKQFPADTGIGARASAAYRSLAAFDTGNTERAIAVEEDLYRSEPGNRETLARIGDILADRELFPRAAPYWDRMATVRPGEAQAYLSAATVYWDYYNFEAALRLLNEGRKKLNDPALFSYEEGAIHENQRDYPAAIAEYMKGALHEGESARSRYRLLDLARRSKLRELVDRSTAPLGEAVAPDLDAVKLRVAVLDAQNRPKDVERLLGQVASRTQSFDLLEWLQATAQQKSMPAVQQSVLERQAALTSDPVRRLELRYALVSFYESNKDLAAAQRNVEALYRENPKVLGVVRATVDFYWRHEQRQRALEVLLAAAKDAYPVLRNGFQFEAARKATEAGQYEPARKLLAQLLTDSPYNGEYLAAVADTYARSGDDQGLKAFYLNEIESFRKAPLAPDARTSQIATLRRGLIPALTRLKDYAGAVDQYIEVINRYPEDEGLTTEAALFAQRYGRQAQLLDYYRNTTRQSPRDYRWPMVLARMLTQLEDYPAAIETYASAINVRPDRVDLRSARAELLERVMRFDDAAAEYQRLFELNYKDTRWMEKVASIRARQQKVPETVAALEVALVENRPEKPENYFEVARRLERWGMLTQARAFALKGVDSAGHDLLASPEHHDGAELYARLLTRLRQQDAAYRRLQTGVTDADSLLASAGVAVQQVQKQGIVSVTDTQWRERALSARREAARSGMERALRGMGSAVARYFTPEEKTGFSGWLEAKGTTAGNSDLASLFLPVSRSAELADLEARWCERLMMARDVSNTASYEARLIDLQMRRMRFQELGTALERYAQAQPYDRRLGILIQAADAYRSGTLYEQELTVMSGIYAQLGQRQQRYFELLLQRHPQALVLLSAAGSTRVLSFGATQYAVTHGTSTLAQAAVVQRGRALPPVWTSAYSALTGLYYADPDPIVNAAFLTALGDASIGERLGKPVDRSRQLAGNTWFYYASRYGEYQGVTGAGDPEDFLPAVLEQSPGSAAGYIMTAEYYAEAGKPDRALQDYAHTLELAPARADVHDRIAMLYWRQGKRAEAVAEWKQALEMLDAQVHQRSVPSSFWPTLSYTLNHIGNRHLLGELRPQADVVLRDYVRQNGSYQADEILRAAFLAAGDAQPGVAWMLELAAVAPDPGSVLNLLASAKWVPDSARDPIYQKLLERSRERARNAQALAQQYAEQETASLQLRYARYLMQQKQLDRAAAQLEALPHQEQPRAEELELHFRLAAERKELDGVLEQYRARPELAPIPETMRQAARGLRQAGLRTAARKVLEYVFTQEIAAHRLTPANLLGLAEIRLEDNDVAGAMELLRRLTIAVGQPFENVDAASSLLARTGHNAEAAHFLSDEVKATPWDANVRVRLAQAQLAAGQEAGAARALALTVARDSTATYNERVNAASLLAGETPPALGSAELDLLARGQALDSVTDKPYFYAARVKAAEKAAGETRAQLLHHAINDTPERDAARVPLFHAYVQLGRDQLAVSSLAPLLRNELRYQAATSTYEARYEAEEASGEAPPAGEAVPQVAAPAPISSDDRAALTFAVGKAYGRLEQHEDALRYLRIAAGQETNRVTRADIEKNISRVRATMRRNANNALRAPTLHAELEQEHVVRPRLVATAVRQAPAKSAPVPQRPTSKRGGAQ